MMAEAAEAVAAVVLAAGQGTRMRSRHPKVLHPLAGRPMIAHLMQAVSALEPARTVVIAASDSRDALAAALPEVTLAVQDPPRGTGHAAMQAREALLGFRGTVLVLFADNPFISEATLRRLVEARRSAGDPAVVVLGFRPDDPAEYGRLITDRIGALERIVEAPDADEAERTVGLCNSGVMAIDGTVLFQLLDALGTANAKGEYYLTDIVAEARRRGRACAVVEGDPAELLGVNNRAQLAEAEAVLQARLRRAAMEGGATLLDPATVWLSWDTRLGRDVTVGPNVFFGPGVTVEDDVEIRPFSHLEGCIVRSGATIGPFARLRPEAEIGAGARIGNFVEVKKASVEAGAKVNHLAYIGDARVGARANVGAGTITCNYDGFLKYFTDIGAGAFIGSNTALVAPVKVGDGAIVGAGSTITSDVPADALAVTRVKQDQKPDWAIRFRSRKAAERDRKKAG